jgi:hypothetical protein
MTFLCHGTFDFSFLKQTDVDIMIIFFKACSRKLHLCWIILNFTNLAGKASVHDRNCSDIIIQHEWVASQPIYSCTSMEQLHVKLKYQSAYWPFCMCRLFGDIIMQVNHPYN